VEVWDGTHCTGMALDPGRTALRSGA